MTDAAFVAAIVEGGERLALVRKELGKWPQRCRHHHEDRRNCPGCELRRQEARLARDDETNRLIYADWLEERGDASSVARASFIRVQCELDQIRLQQDEFAKADISHFDYDRAVVDRRQDVLRKRERELLNAHEGEWSRFICEATGRGWIPHREMSWTCRRGFVEEVTCDAATFLRHGDAIRTATPLRRVVLTQLFLPRPGNRANGAPIYALPDGSYSVPATMTGEDYFQDLVCRRLLESRWPAVEFDLPEARP